jgi:site-specific DNA-methyltransferase (adenine-specific)
MTMNLYIGDCLEYMKGIPDKSIDIVITDPPYGLGDKLSTGSGKLKYRPFMILSRDSNWVDTVPPQQIFDELFRVSNNQIIFGGNYFSLPPTQGIIAWDKLQHLPTFSAWEYIWTSFQRPAKLVRMVSLDKNKCHPTQKPVNIMSWLVNNYTQEGETVFDPFMGSGTTGVACIRSGRNFIGCEIDPDYFAIAEKRIYEASLQPRLFNEINKNSCSIQTELI